MIVGEYSGRIRDALIRNGHDAVSCDFEHDTETPGPHIKDDARRHLHRGWDGMIAHPTCTFVCNSGSKHLYIGGKKVNGPEPDRWAKMTAGAAFIAELDGYDKIPLRAIENPVMLGCAQEIVGRGATQFTQPWWFGDPFFKATGWWLTQLDPLRKTDELTPPKPGTDEHKRWSKVHRMPPGVDRWKNRSRTEPGLAAAIGSQWGVLKNRLYVTGFRFEAMTNAL